MSSESRILSRMYFSVRYGIVFDDSFFGLIDKNEIVVYLSFKFGFGGSFDMFRFDVSDMLKE